MPSLGAELRPRVDDVLLTDLGDEDAAIAAFLLGSYWRHEQDFPFSHVPAPFLKNWLSGTCYARSFPLRRLPFIQKRQGLPLPPTVPEAPPGTKL